jgi:hypothetical protein
MEYNIMDGERLVGNMYKEGLHWIVDIPDILHIERRSLIKAHRYVESIGYEIVQTPCIGYRGK